MRERAALLNIVAELRGRLDELEAMICTAPNHVIITPASYDEDGVVDLTSDGYRAFRSAGLDAPQMLARYEPFRGFTQFGAPDGGANVEISAFPLSDLHRVGSDPAFGLRFEPKDDNILTYYTYEVLTEVEDPTRFQWLEWVLKVALERPVNCFIQVLVEGDGFSESLDIGAAQVSDFAAFRHVRLDRARLMEAAAGRTIRRLRLTLSTGGVPLTMDLYSLAVFGRI